MPITWTPENVSRLFLVTLAVHHIHMDYRQIALAFGGDATARAIEEKMKKLRKEARDVSDGTLDTIPITRRGRGAGRGGFKAVTSTPGKRCGRKPKHLKELEMQQALLAQQNQKCAEMEDDEELRKSCLPETPRYGDLMSDHLLKQAQLDKLKTEDHDSQDNNVFHQDSQQRGDEPTPIDPALEQILYHDAEKYEQNDAQSANDAQQYDDEGDFHDRLDPLLRYQTSYDTSIDAYHTQVYGAYPQSVVALNDTMAVHDPSHHPGARFQTYNYPVPYLPYNESSVDESYETDNGYLHKEMKPHQIQDQMTGNTTNEPAHTHEPALQDPFYHTAETFAAYEADRFGGHF